MVGLAGYGERYVMSGRAMPMGRDGIAGLLGLDACGILDGESFRVSFVEREDDDTHEARVGLRPDETLVRLRWYTCGFSVGQRDEALEEGLFCGVAWRRDAGYKDFYYAIGGRQA